MWGDELLDFDSVDSDSEANEPLARNSKAKMSAGRDEPDYIDMLMDSADTSV